LGDTSRYSNIVSTTYPETGRSKTTETSSKRIWDLQEKSLNIQGIIQEKLPGAFHDILRP
jgi:hypothetical protein